MSGVIEMELDQTLDPTGLVLASLVGETVTQAVEREGGVRLIFASGREIDLSQANLNAHEVQPGEDAVVTVRASFFTTGRTQVSYHHRTDTVDDWRVHRSALVHLVKEIKRAIKWGPRVCPFRPSIGRGT